LCHKCGSDRCYDVVACYKIISLQVAVASRKVSGGLPYSYVCLKCRYDFARNSVLKGYLDIRKRKSQGCGEKCIMNFLPRFLSLGIKKYDHN
jgi:hypothetical protein